MSHNDLPNISAHGPMTLTVDGLNEIRRRFEEPHVVELHCGTHGLDALARLFPEQPAAVIASIYGRVPVFVDQDDEDVVRAVNAHRPDDPDDGQRPEVGRINYPPNYQPGAVA